MLCYHDRFVCSCEMGSILEVGSGSNEEEIIGLMWEPGGRQCHIFSHWTGFYILTFLRRTSETWENRKVPSPSCTLTVWSMQGEDQRKKQVRVMWCLVVSWDTGRAGLRLWLWQSR